MFNCDKHDNCLQMMIYVWLYFTWVIYVLMASPFAQTWIVSIVYFSMSDTMGKFRIINLWFSEVCKIMSKISKCLWRLSVLQGSSFLLMLMMKTGSFIVGIYMQFGHKNNCDKLAINRHIQINNAYIPFNRDNQKSQKKGNKYCKTLLPAINPQVNRDQQ